MERLEGSVGSASFFEKKKQKTFITFGHGRWRRRRPWPRLAEVFCAAFLKKAAAFVT